MELSKATIKCLPEADPLLETYEFISYENVPVQKFSKPDALNSICQIILQNIPGVIRCPSICQFKATVTNEDLIDDIKIILNEQPLVDAVYFEMTNFEIISEYDIILLNETNFLTLNGTNITKYLAKEGFVIYKGSYSKIEQLNLELISNFSTENFDLYLLRKSDNVSDDDENSSVFLLQNDDFSWITNLMLQWKAKNYKKIYLLAENVKYNGFMGLINCLRCEKGDIKIQAFLMDEITDSVHLFSNPIYKDQIKKNLICSIFQNKSWGTYIHKSLNSTEKSDVIHATVNMTSVREYSSLRWYETPPSFLR